MNAQIVVILTFVCVLAAFADWGLVSFGMFKLPAANKKIEGVAQAIQDGVFACFNLQSFVGATGKGFRTPYLLCLAPGTGSGVGLNLFVRAKVLAACGQSIAEKAFLPGPAAGSIPELQMWR
jgi:hypothetical protein